MKLIWWFLKRAANLSGPYPFPSPIAEEMRSEKKYFLEMPLISSLIRLTDNETIGIDR